MGYFSYIAEQAFKTDQEGRRLFYRGGPWSRPYIIPDLATERMLHQWQTVLMQWILGSIIFGQAIILALWPEIILQLPFFISSVVTVSLLSAIAGRLVHRRTLIGLQRAERRLSLRQFYISGAISDASRHSVGALVLKFLGSLAFVAMGYWITTLKGSIDLTAPPAIGWILIIFAGLDAIAWAYALILKLTGVAK